MKISICIPVYNRAQSIITAIDSVFNQIGCDGLKYEVIVVDDGSTDGTSEVVKNKYKNKVTLIYQSNQGDASARNTALKIATGEFIAFQDSDDIWLPTKLSKQLHLFQKHKSVGLVYSPKKVIDLNNKIVQSKKRCYRGHVTKYLFKDIFIPTPSVVIRQDIIKKIGLFNSKYVVCSDYDYWLRASLITKFDFVETPQVICRRSQNSLSKKYPIRNQVTLINLLEKFTKMHGDIIGKKLINKKLSKEYLKLGKLLIQHDKREALKAIKQSLKYKKTLKNYILFLYLKNTSYE